jgi:hypothetical protein
MSQSAKVTTLPYIAPRKAVERPSRFVVKWIQGDMMYFQWFKRDSTACAFLNKLLDAGLEARVLMK